MIINQRGLSESSSIDLFSKTIFTIVGVSTVLILPTTNLDPISLPKFTFTLLALVVLHVFVTFRYSGFLKQIKNSSYLKVIFTFVILLITNLLANNYAIEERLFGVSGRNTGILMYLGFSYITLILVFLNHEKSMLYFAISLTLANIGVCTYFLLQLSGRDFFDFTEYYAAPSSTLGNPNFVSGFVGFAAISAWFFVAQQKNWLNIFLATLSSAISIFVIVKSQSIQGFFSLLGGLLTVLIILVRRRSRKVGGGLIAASILGGVFSFLGFLGMGPLGERLFTTTLLSRMDYWRAALAMTLDSPIFGKGLDSFGDFYREYRDETAFNRFSGQATDSAHNVLLDLLSGGGIPLGVIYFLIQVIPAIMLLKKLLSPIGFDGRELILLSVWVAFILQSVVSINQIGVGIWGWVLSGLIFSQVKSSHLERAKKGIAKREFQAVSLLVLIPIFIFVILAPIRSDSKFLSSANSADGLKLKEISLSWPMDTKRVILTSAGFKGAGYEKLALDISLAGVEHNPNSYVLWKQIYENSEASAQLKLEAERSLLRIEPRFIKGS
jgi:O-antigen ligase